MNKQKEEGLRSAYEIALQKMGLKETPQLSADQRKRLAEIEREFQAKEAELRIGYQSRIEAARQRGDGETVSRLEEELRIELRKLQEKKERRKDAVRRQRDRG